MLSFYNIFLKKSCCNKKFINPLTDSLMLRTLNKDFQQIAMDYHIPCLSFGETEKSVLGAKLKMMIVPPESSGMYSNVRNERCVVCGEEKRKSCHGV